MERTLPETSSLQTCILRKPTAGFAVQNGRIAVKTAAEYIHDLVCKFPGVGFMLGSRWVALPQAPAQWTPIQMAAAGMVLKAGYPRRQGPNVNPQRKIIV